MSISASPHSVRWLKCNVQQEGALRRPLTYDDHPIQYTPIELHFTRCLEGHPIWPYLARLNMRPITAKYGIWGRLFGHAKWGVFKWGLQPPRKDLAKCSSEALNLSQELWNFISGRFPHCNYNVKLKSAGGFCKWVFKFEAFLVTLHMNTQL